MQRDLEEFERDLARYLGAKHVVGMANATDALHLALRAAGVGPGDEVIFSLAHHGGHGGGHSLRRATPVPVECGADHLIDPASVAAAVTPRTKAIMPTQLNGRTADMDALQAIAKRSNLLIIEDAAQALGSKFKGRGRAPSARRGPSASIRPRPSAAWATAARRDQRRRRLRETAAAAQPWSEGSRRRGAVGAELAAGQSPGGHFEPSAEGVRPGGGAAAGDCRPLPAAIGPARPAPPPAAAGGRRRSFRHLPELRNRVRSAATRCGSSSASAAWAR